MKNISIEKLLKKFPKKRGSLSPGLKKQFDKHYKDNRENTVSQLFESWGHRTIKGGKKNILELGAGTLNHLKYIKDIENKFYDIIEPKKFLYKHKKETTKVRKAFKKLSDTSANFYDQIISIMVLEHLTHLPHILAISALKMKKGGSQSHSIPCQGQPVWDISWSLFNFNFYFKTGYSFKEIQRHEHVNNYDEIVSLINYFYHEINIKFSYPLFLNKYTSFYANITFAKPRLKNCKNYLKKIKNKSML